MIRVQGTIPVQTVREEFPEKSLQDIVTEFLSRHPKVRIESINEKFVKGITFCNSPVFEQDKGYVYDADIERFRCPDESCSICRDPATDEDGL